MKNLQMNEAILWKVCYKNVSRKILLHLEDFRKKIISFQVILGLDIAIIATIFLVNLLNLASNTRIAKSHLKIALIFIKVTEFLLAMEVSIISF